jgi:hypothetical protein
MVRINWVTLAVCAVLCLAMAFVAFMAGHGGGAVVFLGGLGLLCAFLSWLWRPPKPKTPQTR